MKRPKDNERGFVLILALVTMVAMTVIGVSLVMNMNVDTQLSRNERDAKLAFQLADAGVQEAIARLRLSTSNSRYIGELTTDANYRATGWNTSNALAKDFGVGVGGDRNSVDNLDYSVSITYLDETNSEGFCDSNEVAPNDSGNSTVPPGSCSNTTAELVMYGQDFNIDSTVTSIQRGKQPVYRIVSTGTQNGTSRTIETYVGASALNTDTDSAINTNECIKISGGSYTINGGVKEAGTGGCITCDDGAPGCAAKAYDEMTTYLGDDLSEIIDMADERHQCLGATCADPGDDIPASGSIDGVITDWGDFAGDTYSTFIYINNAGGKAADISGNFTGRGILVVSGDLKLSGNLAYEGLVYVLGQLTIGGGGGSLNVLGGVMANSTVQLNGSITVTYDQATLEEVAKESSSSAILIWKRL